MTKTVSFLIFLSMIWLLGCKSSKSKSTSGSGIDQQMFRHHYIARDLPGEASWGYGCPVSEDFDNDGDQDYAMTCSKGFYWFENSNNDTWQIHKIGTMPIRFLGATSYDVDYDGWQDILIGGYWYRNTGDPRSEEFEVYCFDDNIDTNIHDVEIADIDGNGKDDLVLMGEGEGVFWYNIPDDPLQPTQWEKNTITLDGLVSRERIHGGFSPNGIGDLDGDNDNDIVLPDRWMENVDGNGMSWKKHPIPFGKRGPFGLSARSWIIDLDKDGDNDIVMTDCDQKASRAAWLENSGDPIPKFTAHFLPMSAPGIRGSFHSLYVGDFDNDGDPDIFTCDQEDKTLLPEGAFPRWYIWENVSDEHQIKFVERIILDKKLGGHDAIVKDMDNDGDLDILSKVWHLWPDNANQGIEHVDYLENKLNEIKH